MSSGQLRRRYWLAGFRGAGLLPVAAALVLGAGCAASQEPVHGSEPAPAAAAAGETPHSTAAAPASAAPAPARPAGTAAVATRPEGARPTAEVVAELGESPIAAVLEVLGPDVREYNAHITTLSNPFFEGRVPGSRGNRMAADYIEMYFKQAGLKPVFSSTGKAADGTEVVTPAASYRQPFQAGTELSIARKELTLRLGDGDVVRLEEGKDFSVLGFSGDGALSAPVAFVGYSIQEGRDGYASYPEGTDLAGKVALVLRFEPMDENGKSLWNGGEEGWSMRAGLEPKLRAAAERGAAAIIVVNAPGADDPRAKTLTTTASSRGNLGENAVPVVMITGDAADRLAKAGGAGSLLDLRHAADKAGGVVDLPGPTVSLDIDINREPTMTDNVAGLLPGRGNLAGEYVVIGAHYDHVGFGPIGTQPSNNGKLHPGADDNGSGTSGLILLAEKIARDYAALPEGAPARSIIFMGFSAEESGLNGSRHFVQHPPVSIADIKFMINMDMIGRLRDGELEVDGVGTAMGLAEWAKPYWDESGLKVAAKPGGFGPSDHASFAAAGIPVLFFFTGLHKEYHTPADVGSLINQVGAVKVVNLVEKVAMAVATRGDAFTPTYGDQAARDQAAGPGPVRSKVRFGIAPGDYSGSEPGVLVGDVYDGTSAAEAGLKAGDLITGWNGKKVGGVEEWMPMLAEHNPGDVVEITYIRDGKEQTTKATLKGRARPNG